MYNLATMTPGLVPKFSHLYQWLDSFPLSQIQFLYSYLLASRTFDFLLKNQKPSVFSYKYPDFLQIQYRSSLHIDKLKYHLQSFFTRFTLGDILYNHRLYFWIKNTDPNCQPPNMYGRNEQDFYSPFRHLK